MMSEVTVFQKIESTHASPQITKFCMLAMQSELQGDTQTDRHVERQTRQESVHQISLQFTLDEEPISFPENQNQEI